MKKLLGLGLLVLGLLVFSSCIMYSPSGEPGGYGGTYDQPQGTSNEPSTTYGPNYGYGRNMDISYFYDYLSDYGTWITYPGYGYVWVPYEASRSWHPFSHGRWVWTEYGWTWVSYYRWGWITSHYGRWDWELSLGWFWVPDTVWGPAWVSWRYADDCIGWAPLPPRYRYSRGYGLSLTSIDLSDDYWIFVDGPHFSNPYVERYVLPRYRNGEFIRRTVFKAQLNERSGRIINDGLSLNNAERITRERFTTYQLRDADRPGLTTINSNQVTIYRPDIAPRETAQPKRFVSKDEAARQGTLIPSGGINTSDQTIQLQERHKVELQNLERGQQQEILQTQKQYDQDLARTRSSAEKVRLQKDRDQALTELKSHHAVEKSSLKKRQQDEITGARTKRATVEKH